MADTKKNKYKTIGDDPRDDDVSQQNGVAVAGDHEDLPPKAKILKLENNITTKVDVSLNSIYNTVDVIKSLTTNWQTKEDGNCFKCTVTEAKIYNDPFQICLLPKLLQNNTICKELVHEIIENVHWSRKQMDLYEFYQSTDLSNMTTLKLLTSFKQMLRQNIRPWLEKITNLKLDYVSASCSMYTSGDYLLVHDDLLKDRQIAFIYYLTPWDGAEKWTDAQGGCLEILGSDENCFPHFPVKLKISPTNNQFVFFKVGSRSFHQVGEVTNFDYPRLTINGWFHGAANESIGAVSPGPSPKLVYKFPIETHGNLELLLNEVYLKPVTRKSIQKRIEDNSEICLYEFIRREMFDEALKQLLNDETLCWRRQGPANICNYEVLELNSVTKTIAKLLELFTGTEMFELMHDYTDLDISGANAASPSCAIEIQKWSHGDYTIMGDDVTCDDNTLDLIYYLNATDGVGVTTYLSPDIEPQAESNSINSIDEYREEDSVLLTITAVDNALNIIYRCKGTTKFTKHVSRNTPMEKGPVFIISCSFKE